MVKAHAVLAVLVVTATATGFVWGAIGLRRGSSPGFLLRNVLALCQTLLIAQVAIGLLLLSDERRVADELHYLYGTLALGAVLSPWLYAPIEPRRRLAWFVGASLLAALLATRAYMTSG